MQSYYLVSPPLFLTFFVIPPLCRLFLLFLFPPVIFFFLALTASTISRVFFSLLCSTCLCLYLLPTLLLGYLDSFVRGSWSVLEDCRPLSRSSKGPTTVAYTSLPACTSKFTRKLWFLFIPAQITWTHSECKGEVIVLLIKVTSWVNCWKDKLRQLWIIQSHPNVSFQLDWD